MTDFRDSFFLEAICEIVFMPSVTFDYTLPGILYSELKSDFPHKKDKPNLNIGIPDLNNPQATEFLNVPITQFYNLENDRVVQVGKDILINNQVAPNKNWIDFFKQIVSVAELYHKNLSERKSIRYIALKYIYKIDIQSTSSFKKYFTFPLPLPPGEKYSKVKAFNTNVEFSSGKGNILGKSFRSIIPTSQGVNSSILELVNLNNITNFSIEDLESWLQSSYDAIQDLLLASISE